MPTLPSSPAHEEWHRAREAAESFGTDPERYDRTRPRYPQALVDRIVAGSPGRDVLDVGIGTGISARPFRAAGCRVLGVEVDARMAAFAREDGFDVEVARFDDWESAGRTFDLVIAGMSWHWVDPTVGPTKAADILRTRGRLAAVWNVGRPPPDLAQAFSAVYERVLPDTPFAAMPNDPWPPTSAASPTPPTRFARPPRSANQSDGRSTQNVDTRRISGSSRCRPSAGTAGCRADNSTSCSPASRPRSTRPAGVSR